MNIYFAGSVRGGKSDQELYTYIVNRMKSIGNVFTEEMSTLPAEGAEKTDRDIYEENYSWIIQCDAMVAEVSTPSSGVGFEIGMAISKQKSVLCLYREQPGKKLSAMIAGCPFVTNKTYQIEEDLPQIIDAFFSKIKQPS